MGAAAHPRTARRQEPLRRRPRGALHRARGRHARPAGAGRAPARRARDALPRQPLQLGTLRTMADFDWGWPKHIDRTAVESALALDFMARPANVVLVAPQGLGKTMIAQNIAYNAVQAGHSVLFTTAQPCSSSTTSDCGPSRVRRASTCTRLSVVATSVRPLASPPIAPWRSGLRCLVTHCWPAPPWTDCCTTPMSSPSRVTATATHRSPSAPEHRARPTLTPPHADTWRSPCRTGLAEPARPTPSRFLGASRPDLIGRTEQRPDWPSLDMVKARGYPGGYEQVKRYAPPR
ncbi:IS21 family transposition helper protein [Corallococcus macrosporus]|uniref:IS21 family transposition helper protein n=1 Tax=Myxococcus fulvus (strain ATCC BAA-855 / HW-1) TaxID=483219 RepID=F8C767_MYXFH|nr:IS21 family transposition helper protein [Corallococcus macrosporus]